MRNTRNGAWLAATLGLIGAVVAGACSSSGETPSGSSATATSSSGAGGAGGDAISASSGAGGAGGAGGSAADARPDKPADLVNYVTGADADADVTPAGPGLILMGGSTEVDAAFEWWKPYVKGGDVVIIRATGADGYNDYLYSQIGGFDSVETLIIDTKTLANSDYVAWTLKHAEGIFIAGGDQSDYMSNWKDTGVEDALHAAYARGASIGGTSAGLAVLGEFVYAAYNDSVTSDEAMADPYSPLVTLDKDFLAFPLTKGLITDSHFQQRDRMGRLVTFLARIIKDGWANTPVGVGIDEETALVVEPTGNGKVMGLGAAYVLRTASAPGVCEAQKPLDFQSVSLQKLVDGDTVTLPDWDASAPKLSLSVVNGQLSPANPY